MTEPNPKPTVRQRLNQAGRATIESVKRRPKTWAAGSSGVIAIIAYIVFAIFWLSMLERYARLSGELAHRVPDINERVDERISDQYMTIDGEVVTEGKQVDEGPVLKPIIRRNSYIIQLEPNADIEDVESLLADNNLKVNGGIKEAGILFAETVDEPNTSNTNEASPKGPVAMEFIERLKADPIVRDVAADFVVAPNIIPAFDKTEAFDRGGDRYVWDWASNASKRDGNWGHKFIRLPAAWSIVKAKMSVSPDAAPIRVGIVDAGFQTHEDLTFNGQLSDLSILHSHGNHVAGIIGASHENAKGIEGVVPSVDIIARPFRGRAWKAAIDAGNFVTSFEVRQAAMSDSMRALQKLVSEVNGLRVVNASFGLNSGEEIRSADHEKRAQLEGQLISLGGMVHILFQIYGESHDVLFVVSAGNDSLGGDPLEAKLGSPLTWAALEGGGLFSSELQNTLVVGALNREGDLWERSNIGAHVSAPGEQILSSVSGSASSYGVKSGTSMAAPYVTGLAALLLTQNPTLSTREIRSIIIETAIPLPDGKAPHVDALEALLKADESALRYLADVNGDQTIDASDVESFVAAYTALQSGNFDLDFNGDGKVTDFEDRWAQIDLNGSGSASVDQADSRRVLGRTMTDLDVLKAAFDAAGVDFPDAAISLEALEGMRRIGDSN